MSDIVIVPNREAWLQAAVQRLRPLFLGHNYKVPEIQVSVGWPSSGGLSTKKRVIGQCHFGVSTADGKSQLFISPLLDEVLHPQGVLSTLVHEVCHVVAGVDAKHGPHFVKVMKKLGLEGKPTSTVAGDELLERLKNISNDLGAFPHSRIVPHPKNAKPQTTRMVKCECAECGYVARTARKWIDDVGAPWCPADKIPMKVSLPATEGEGE